jgi:hypothetical protein
MPKIECNNIVPKQQEKKTAFARLKTDHLLCRLTFPDPQIPACDLALLGLASHNTQLCFTRPDTNTEQSNEESSSDQQRRHKCT